MFRLHNRGRKYASFPAVINAYPRLKKMIQMLLHTFLPRRLGRHLFPLLRHLAGMGHRETVDAEGESHRVSSIGWTRRALERLHTAHLETPVQRPHGT